MKECPNCSMELPDEAHYCPRCMFQYEKQEIQINDRHRKRTSLLLIGSVFVIGVFICVPFVRSRIQDNMNNNYTEVDIKKIVNENFRTGENIIYDSEVENDLRDVLGNEFVDMKATLGEETDEMYHENGMDIYTFGMITVTVNQEGVIQDILIDYTVGENKKEYGVYGIAGTSDIGVVKTILGTPDQEYEKELCYRFDREFGLGLNINFSDDGMVEQLEYYYVQ
ncbi:zinc ribbon domain-containing protein [Faecalicatena contorta]|uniref:zinc ribbon domain-containing protein n=1 Tax=Faecalicatena contorta TaxID=39482 RepID=UPI001F1573B3|nr:zinc ribbon domain-containing protein [Faecalicatena contorta]MCF2684336.1 zinc ribbon domain-containing protein [Faecalicatena contorta]